MSADVRTLQCPDCAGTLTLRGGRRVQMIVCPSCGSRLDMQADLKVLNFGAKRGKLNPSPIEIGMSGVLKGTEFFVIGRVDYKQTEDGETYRWTEFQLYSPLRGYAWLCEENGHWVLAREVKDVPSEVHFFNLARGSSFKARGESWRVYENSQSEITGLEGELTWHAELGEQQEFVDGIAPPRVFTLTRRPGEIEFSCGEYVWPEEVKEAFNLSFIPSKTGVFGPEPFKPIPTLRALSRLSLLFILISLIGIGFFGSREQLIYQERFLLGDLAAWDGHAGGEFEVRHPGSLMRIDFESAVRNEWIWVATDIQQGDKSLIRLSREISFYKGSDWSEGSQQAKAYFRLPETGRYQLRFEGEGGAQYGTLSPRTSVRVEVFERVYVTRYLWILLGLMVTAFALPYAREFIFHQSKWSEEED